MNVAAGLIALAMAGQSVHDFASVPLALLPPTVSPVSVRSCSLSTSRGGSVVWIAFVNRAKVAADDVSIEVKLPGGDPFEIVDRGRFYPNVDIDHAFRPPSTATLTSGGTASCRIAHAHFEDGTVWEPGV